MVTGELRSVPHLLGVTPFVQTHFGVFKGGGKCGALVRSIDWAKTSLGSADSWPVSLRTTVSTLLNCRHPMFLWWGPELIQFYNDAYVPIFGGGRHHPAAMGQRGQECWPESWSIIGPQIEDVMMHGISSWNEHQLVPMIRNGHLEPVRWTYGYSPVYSDDGKVGGTLVVCNETVPRGLSENALPESESRLLRIVEASGAGLWDLDAGSGKITGDSRMLMLLGLKPGTLLDLDTGLACVHEEDRERVSYAVHSALLGDDGGRYLIEFRTVGPENKSIRWVESRAHLISASWGKPERLAGAIIDITDRKKAEVERERAVEILRHQAEFEQQLIGIVSHDLRNPISVVLLGAGSLLRRGELSATQTKSVALIKSSAERAARMIRDLLDFTQARLGSGIHIERQAMDLYDLIRNNLAEIEVTHVGREISMQLEGEGRGEWDADRLSQVVQNLVMNAIKYSPENTPVTVQADTVGDEVVFRVRNEGTPIPPALLSMLFKPLQRATNLQLKDECSIGLGLFIVEQIVQAHGGIVSVESSQSLGTTFQVRLPRQEV